MRILARALLFSIALVAIAGCYKAQDIVGDAATDTRDTFVWDSTPDSVPDTSRPDSPVPDAVDVPPDEDPWPCTPEFAAHARNILGGLSVNTGSEGDPDHPDLITLDNEQVWLISRVVDSPGATDTPKLTLVMVNPTNANPNSSYYHPIGSAELDSMHPITQFFDPMEGDLAIALAFADVEGISEHQMMYWQLESPPATGIFAGFPGTDQYSTQPAIASSDIEMLIAWRQESGSGEPASIEFGIVNEAGEVSARGSMSESELGNPSHPLVVYNGSGYGILYHENVGDWGTLWLAQINEDGGVTYPPYDLIPSEAISGGAASTWNGSEYAIVIEGPRSLHFVLRSPSGGGSGSSIHDALVPTTGPITDPLGMLDMVWTGTRYGVVWTHENSSTGSHVWFFELSRYGDLLNGPHLLNPESVESFNPAITWIETPTMRYYVFAWNEFTPTYGWHVLFTYSYGCSL